MGKILYSTSLIIPRAWADFFTISLLSPHTFDWSKFLLNSKAWEYVLEHSDSVDARKLVLPKTCPEGSKPICTSHNQLTESSKVVITEEGSDILQKELITPTAEQAIIPKTKITEPSSSVTTSQLHMKRKSEMIALVKTDLRRSERLKGHPKGFRTKTCMVAWISTA